MVRNRLWFRGENGIYRIATFYPKKNELQGVTLFSMGRPFRLEKRIDAERGVWQEDGWTFYDVEERTFKQDGSMEVSFSPSQRIELPESPEDFKAINEETEEMPVSKLWHFIKKVAAEGYDPTPYRVELHKKIAYPALNIITVLLGIPFALRMQRYGGLAVAMVISLSLGFVYWVIFEVTLSIASAGLLPPFIAAWIANALFGGLGIYLLLRVEEQAVF